MRYSILIIFIGIVSLSEANILDTIKEKAKNIGRQTPIDIALYAKNPSTVCSLTITNIVNPYGQDMSKRKLPPITLEAERYYRDDVKHLLKGAYEFEYRWNKKETFVDSRLKTIHIFAYHDTRNRVHKKVNLTFLLRVPQGCR